MTANGFTGQAIGIVDVDGLADALAEKIEGPLTTADISDLAAALALKMNAAGGEVVDSTFLIRKGDWSAALRFRSTGGAVDVDKTNGDVVISSFAGTPEDVFGGAQTGLARLRADGITFSGGLIEFGSTVYAAEQWISTATGSAGLRGATPIPADHGLAGWTFDPRLVQGGTILATAGVSHVARIKAMSASITNLLIHLTAGGATLTAGQCYATLHTDAGVQIGASADQATAWASGGLKTMPLAGGPLAVTRGNWYKVRFWFNGTTGPTVSRGVNSSSAILNVGLAAAASNYATADTGLTTLAGAPATIGTLTGGSTGWWVGLS